MRRGKGGKRAGWRRQSAASDCQRSLPTPARRAHMVPGHGCVLPGHPEPGTVPAPVSASLQQGTGAAGRPSAPHPCPPPHWGMRCGVG